MTETPNYVLLLDREREATPADVVGRTARVVTDDRVFDKWMIRGYGSGLLVITKREPFGGGVYFTQYVPLADLRPGSRILDIPHAPQTVVDIANRGQTSLYQGVWISRVTIVATCPLCGGPRGAPVAERFCEDGAWYTRSTWTNPCGHTDLYDNVLIEAGVHLPQHLREAA